MSQIGPLIVTWLSKEIGGERAGVAAASERVIGQSGGRVQHGRLCVRGMYGVDATTLARDGTESLLAYTSAQPPHKQERRAH